MTYRLWLSLKTAGINSFHLHPSCFSIRQRCETAYIIMNAKQKERKRMSHWVMAGSTTLLHSDVFRFSVAIFPFGKCIRMKRRMENLVHAKKKSQKSHDVHSQLFQFWSVEVKNKKLNWCFLGKMWFVCLFVCYGWKRKKKNERNVMISINQCKDYVFLIFLLFLFNF